MRWRVDGQFTFDTPGMLELMKMEILVAAPVSGIIHSLQWAAGQQVKAEQRIRVTEPEAAK